MYLKLIVIELKSTMDQNIKIVMKFGGTSMADMDCISKVADHIERNYLMGPRLPWLSLRWPVKPTAS